MGKRQVAVKPDSTLQEAPVRSLPAAAAQPAASPFFSFSCSVTAVSHVGGRTRIESRTTRLAGGKLVAQAFEGELEGDAYGRIAQHALDQVGEQVRAM